MQRIFRENGLSLVLLAMFLASIVGQILFGLHESNEDRQQHGLPVLGFGDYLTSSHFLEATMENWESEFLQMACCLIEEDTEGEFVRKGRKFHCLTMMDTVADAFRHESNEPY